MEKARIKTALILSVMVLLSSVAGAEQFTGIIGSAAGPNWQSSWIDLSKAINLGQGEKLKITLHGSAKNIIVRLLPSGAHPSSSDGIVGGIMEMPEDGILQIQLPEDRNNIVQISVHGGQKAWDISLGSNNGPVTLVSVERVN